MYDATTRATYAELFKAAESALPAIVRDALVKAASKEPSVAAALVSKRSR